jgi:tetratricopeptide (TPR) repeat protein
MRKLNVKLFLALVIGAAAAAGGVWALHSFQYQRIAAALLWQARRADEAGNPDRLAHYLQRYLDFAPQDVQEQAHLGQVLAGEHFAGDLARRRQAFYLLSKVAAKESDRRDLQRLLVKTALEIGEFNSARRTLEALTKNAPADADPAERGELEGYWGRLLEAEKNPAEAIEHCRRAIQDAPSNEDSYVRLAWLLRGRQATAAEREKNIAEADRAIDDLVANNPGSAKAHLARWRYRREFSLMAVRGRAEPGKIPVDKAAAEDVEVALAHAPEDVDALIAKADSEVFQDNGDRTRCNKAYDFLQQGLKLQATQGYRGASDMAEFDLLWHLGTLLLSDPKLASDDARVAEVKDTIVRIRKTRGQPAAGDYLEARLLIHQKEWAKAAALLERTRPALAARSAHSDLLGQIDLCMGQCFEALEEWPQAEQAFKRALEWDKNSLAAVSGLGTAERMLGRFDEALENLVKAAPAAPEPGKAWLDVARLEILRQLEREPRDWTQAQKFIDAAALALPKDAKESVQPALLRAEILALQNDVADAEKLLKDARKAHPDRVEFWTALADLAARGKPEKEAMAILDEADRALGDRVELRVSRAMHLAAEPTAANLTELDALVKKDRAGFDADAQDRLLSGLAEAEIRADRPAEAAALLKELAATPAHRTDLRLRLTLFDLALRSKDPGELDKALEEIREVEGGRGAFYELGQGLRSIHLARQDQGGARKALDEAWRALDRAAELQPDWSAVELARADAAELGGDPEAMISHLKEAIKLEQGRAGPAVIQRLVEALNQRGRYGESKDYLVKLQQSLLVNSPLFRLAAGNALNTGDLARATELIQTIPSTSTDYRDLLLRARFHEAMGHEKEAEEDYRQATDAAPRESVVWVGYVLFLANHGRQAEALPLVKNDIPAKVAPERAGLAVAECYEVLSLATEANAAYDAALAARPDDSMLVRAVTAYRLRTGRIQDAVPLLDRIVKREVSCSDADVQWARRVLGLILSGGTDYRDFRRAAELVGLKLDASGVLQADADPGRPDSAEARRAKARVLATQPQRQYRARAIQLLESLTSADPDDQFVLALLYEADGAEAKEAEILKHLASLDDRLVQPNYLSQYAHLLLHQGESDRARLGDVEPVIARLEQLENDRGQGQGAFGSVELRARLLELRAQGEEALKLLRDFANRRGGKPEEALLIAASLGRQKRYVEAFDLIEKEDLWNKCRPEVIGGACEALLRAMDKADEQRDRVQAWLLDAIAKNPKLPVLKMHLADLYDLRGEYDRAEAQYREVLKDEPGNVVALNNLAWLLSHKTGQGKEALKYIDAAVNGMGRRADLLDTRGEVELALGDAAAALTDFAEAISDAPTGPRLFHLARAQYEARDRDAAVRTLQRARTDFGLQPSSLHPTEQQIYQTLLNELKVK